MTLQGDHVESQTKGAFAPFRSLQTTRDLVESIAVNLEIQLFDFVQEGAERADFVHLAYAFDRLEHPLASVLIFQQVQEFANVAGGSHAVCARKVHFPTVRVKRGYARFVAVEFENVVIDNDNGLAIERLARIVAGLEIEEHV